MGAAILVTGGTGTLGRAVVRELLERDRRPVILSRRERCSDDPAGVRWVTGDLVTGERVADAVADVGAIVHCATDYRHPRNDVHATRRLMDTALLGGSPHLIYVSIVGVDRIPFGYYRAKFAAEQVLLNASDAEAARWKSRGRTVLRGRNRRTVYAEPVA